jgi:hypothetical protein
MVRMPVRRLYAARAGGFLVRDTGFLCRFQLLSGLGSLPGLRCLGGLRSLSGLRDEDLALGHDISYRFEYTAIAGAAAQVAGQRLAALQLGGGVIALQEVVDGHGHAGNAEAALDGSALGQGALHVRRPAVLGEAFDGTDLGAGRGRGGNEAGGDQTAVDLDDAGSALPL